MRARPMKLPGLRALPAARLLMLGEIVLLAGRHLRRLDRQERRRLLELVRIGRGRRRSLSLAEREELSQLLERVAPREFLVSAAQRVSPMKIPEPVIRRFR